MLYRLAAVITIFAVAIVHLQAQTKPDASFSKTKMMVESNGKYKETNAIVNFLSDRMVISTAKKGTKTFQYNDIVLAEYSYSKSPRWKTGLGLGAVGVVFPLIWLVAIPLGFTKHRRHWFTVRTESDYAVLRLSKSNRKLFVPEFETRTGKTVIAVGEDK